MAINNHKHLFLKMAALILCCFLLSGCWDRRELQERSFVLAVAIDKTDEASIKPLDKFAQNTNNRPYRVSLQILQFSPIEKGESKPGSSSTTYVISNTGQTVFEIIRDLAAKNSKTLWFEHIQVIIFSEAVLQENDMQPLLDFFRRDSEIRPRTKMYVTPGEARKILEIQPKTGEPGGISLANISRLYGKNPHIPATNVDLGSTSVQLDKNADFALPRIEYSENEVKINGLALFKKGRFKGYLDEYAIQGGKFILGLEKSALIAAPNPADPSKLIVFELFRHETTLKPHIHGDQIYFELKIAMRGNIGEMNLYHRTDDKEFQDSLCRAIEDEVKRNVDYGHHANQQFNVDALHLGSFVKAYEPETWENIKDRWDDLFPTIPIYTTVKVSITNPGEHK